MSNNENKESALALITSEDLSLVSDNQLNAKQLQHILKRTPAKYIRERPAKGGGNWKYVTGGYITKCLNLMFGWNWDFEIVETHEKYGQVCVLGKLTCRTEKGAIIKMQWGRKDIICKKNSSTPLDYGNDLKAASTDALKKCASEIGIAADIYNEAEFKEIKLAEIKEGATKDSTEDVDFTFEAEPPARTEPTADNKNDDDNFNFEL